jgi:hypothetical protein
MTSTVTELSNFELHQKKTTYQKINNYDETSSPGVSAPWTRLCRVQNHNNLGDHHGFQWYSSHQDCVNGQYEPTGFGGDCGIGVELDLKRALEHNGGGDHRH